MVVVEVGNVVGAAYGDVGVTHINSQFQIFMAVLIIVSLVFGGENAACYPSEASKPDRVPRSTATRSPGRSGGRS